MEVTRRIALYWHNGRSLGHTVRSATLGQGLLERMPGSAVVGITAEHQRALNCSRPRWTW
ncbi:MAG: hypothetical protein E6I32_11580 [Chloroflexi bacterium]|nr:MAG: hypothetical protein E6I32_11580 [Chloroflexota bacterium]